MFQPTKIFGLILDLSLQHGTGGRRVFDEVRKELCTVLRTWSEDDGFYLYQPEADEVLFERGQQTCVLATYEPDGYPLDLTYALRQTFLILAEQEFSIRRVLCLVTDRFTEQQVSGLQKLLHFLERDWVGCQCVVLGIGNRYARSILEQLPSPIRFYHLERTEQIKQVLTEVIGGIDQGQ